MCVNLSGSLSVGYFCPCVCSSYWGYFDPYSNVHVANMGPTWILSAPCGPHYVGPINLAFRVIMCEATHDTVILADAIAPYPVTETDPRHYGDVIMSAKAFQITGGVIVYSTVCSGSDQRKHQSSPLLAFVRGIHRRVNSPRKGPVQRKMFLFDDVIMSIFIWAVSVTMWTCSGKDGTFYVSFICDIAMDKTSVFFPIQLPKFFNCFLSTFLQNVQNTDLEKKGIHWNIYKHAINENCFSVYVIGVFFYEILIVDLYTHTHTHTHMTYGDVNSSGDAISSCLQNAPCTMRLHYRRVKKCSWQQSCKYFLSFATIFIYIDRDFNIYNCTQKWISRKRTFGEHAKYVFCEVLLLCMFDV